MPIFDFEALKAKLLVCARVLLMQLKMVVFPIFVIPMIPHFKPIVGKFLAKVLNIDAGYWMLVTGCCLPPIAHRPPPSQIRTK
jgi:hypothetical protein